MQAPLAGDTDYSSITSYTSIRRADPRIAARIHAPLGNARTVLNVGAGAGSYEPTDRWVLAVEPSDHMRARRPKHAAPALNASALSLPFDDNSFDATMAILTIHQWPDQAKGLAELRRVTRGPIVIITFDAPALRNYWLADFAPEHVDDDCRRFPTIDHLLSMLGPNTTVSPVPIPIDCTDGFTEAFYARPERFLDPAVRAAQSVWSFGDPAVHARSIAALERSLASGDWDCRYGHHRSAPEYHGALRLIVSHPA